MKGWMGICRSYQGAEDVENESSNCTGYYSSIGNGSEKPKRRRKKNK